MKVTIQGTLHELQPVQIFDSGFQKQVAVICPNPNSDYPDFFPVEMLKDNVGMMDNVQPGGECTIECFLGGREYEGRYYLSLKFFKLGAHEAATPEPSPRPQAAAPASNNDMPF